MTRDDAGGPDDFREGVAEAFRGLRTVFVVAGGALLLLLIGLLVPRACPPTMQILRAVEIQCALPDYRPTVALAAAVVVALGSAVSAAAARKERRPATGQNGRSFRTGILMAIIGSGLGLAVMLALASGLVLGARR